MSKLSLREIIVCDLPMTKDVTLMRPEQVVLRFGDTGTVDMGALCYLRRGASKKRNVGRSVALDSFCEKRREQVRDLIQRFSDEFAYSGARPWTLFNKANSFALTFMTWIETSGNKFPENESMAHTVFRSFVSHLHQLVRQNTLSPNTAAQHQQYALDVLGELLGVENLAQGVNLVRFDSQATEITNPPCEDKQSKMLALCEAIFSGFTNLILGKLPYPYCLGVPKYLGWPGDCLWVFPTTKWCLPPHKHAKRYEMIRPTCAYDYVNGRLATFQEIEGYYPDKCVAHKVINDAKKRIFESNEDAWHYYRRQAAMLALNAFALRFVANTGMNKAQFFELKWSGKYEVGTERQRFHVIKWRAAGRKCHFEIEASFLSDFKRFLQLRDHILDGMPCDRLFFTLGANFSDKPKRLTPMIFNNLHTVLQNIDPQIQMVTTKEWRAAKSDWLIRKTDPATAATILQNSEEALRKSYAAGSVTLQMEEMSSFFVGVAETVVKRGITIDHGVDRAAGVCSSSDKPRQLRPATPVVPDCRTPEGCLFCTKYKVHADERDTRKLLSCRYCLIQISRFAANEEQFQKIFTPFFDRIGELLAEIDLREAGLVEKIRLEVEESGELDQYWASKLEMLAVLELI